MSNAPYDVLVIGGGQAGIPLAHALAGEGRRVALAERRHLGGSCVNFGCTPTKAALASARVAHQARRAAEYGIGVPEVTVDFPAVLARELGKNGKATELGETRGFVKLVTDAGSGRILGAAVLAAEGAEIVHVYIDLMNAGAPVSVLRDALHIHPTLAEATQSVTRLLT